MKLLTVCIPCYNSIENMHKTITSCFLMKEEIEVLIIDNNSTDETLEVAREYEKAYPEIVRVIENNNDEAALKVGLEHSKGLYFKLLECGDYLDQPSLVSVIETLRDFIRIQANLDLLLTDYKYVNSQKKDHKVSYKNIFPTETLFKWHNIKAFQKHFQVDIGAIIVKTSILKDVKDKIKNDDFVNDLAIYGTVPYIKSMYYLQTYFYCYGSKKTFHFKAVDQYIELIKKLWTMYDVYSLKSRRQRHYVIEQLSKTYVIVQYLLIKNNDIEKKNKLNDELQQLNPRLFKAVTHHLFGMLLNVQHAQIQNAIIKIFEKLYGYDVKDK